MQLVNAVESVERQRLSGQLQQRGAQTGLSSGGMFLFGMPFLGVGVWAALAGTRVIPIDRTNLHAPHWVLAMFGVVFAMAGVLLWSMGWRQFRANRRHQELARRDPALADYPWNPRGFTPPRGSRVAKSIGGLIFFTAFLSMFNWWAFFNHGPTMVKIIVGVFDLILLLAAWQVGILIGRTLKFSGSRIEFAHFPYRPGETATLHWLVPSGIRRVAKGTFTLRCIEEWYETSGSGRDRSKRLVHEQVWGATLALNGPQELLPGKLEELRFTLPPDAASTSLSGGKAVFWDLAVELDLAGLDFKETYLVPVYAP